MTHPPTNTDLWHHALEKAYITKLPTPIHLTPHQYDHTPTQANTKTPKHLRLHHQNHWWLINTTQLTARQILITTQTKLTPQAQLIPPNTTHTGYHGTLYNPTTNQTHHITAWWLKTPDPDNPHNKNDTWLWTNTNPQPDTPHQATLYNPNQHKPNTPPETLTGWLHTKWTNTKNPHHPNPPDPGTWHLANLTGPWYTTPATTLEQLLQPQTPTQQILNTIQTLCHPNTNRPKHIYKQLKQHKLNPQHTKIPWNGHNITLTPTNTPTQTITAHHDRAPNTPGANDNTAATATLLHYALHHWNPHGTTTLTWVDHEEPGPWGIAHGSQHLPHTPLNTILDVTGIGNTILISTNTTPNPQNQHHTQQATQATKHPTCTRWTPPSDNISLPGSQLISIIPHTQAHQPHPQIWNNLHTPKDHPNTIQPQALQITLDLLHQLCQNH